MFINQKTKNLLAFEKTFINQKTKNLLAFDKAFKRGSLFCSFTRSILQNEDPAVFACDSVWKSTLSRL